MWSFLCNFVVCSSRLVLLYMEFAQFLLDIWPLFHITLIIMGAVFVLCPQQTSSVVSIYQSLLLEGETRRGSKVVTAIPAVNSVVSYKNNGTFQLSKNQTSLCFSIKHTPYANSFLPHRTIKELLATGKRDCPWIPIFSLSFYWQFVGFYVVWPIHLATQFSLPHHPAW